MAATLEKQRSHNFIDLAGKTFGRLTVLEYAGKRSGRVQWKCKCECGTVVNVLSWCLTKSHTTSCGCFFREARRASNITHGHSFVGRISDEYRIWNNIKERCHKQSNRAYRNYGGRGIGMCREWRESFQSFYDSMGPRPSSLHSIERKDNDGPYSPSNCVWATRKEQSRNTRRTRRVTFNGATKSVVEWSEDTGLPYSALQARLARGWPVSKALTIPVGVTFSKAARKSLRS